MKKEIDMKKYEFFQEAVEGIDLLKKRWLQAEYLGREIVKPGINDVAETRSMEGLVAYIKKYLGQLEELITPEEVERLDMEEYTVYTDDHHHRKYWNEIELPIFLLEFAVCMKSRMGCHFRYGKDQYELNLYDLSNFSLFFDTLEELEAVIKEHSVAPATVFKMTFTGQGPSEYESEELYCY